MIGIMPYRQMANDLDYVHLVNEEEVFDLGQGHIDYVYSPNEEEANYLDYDVHSPNCLDYNVYSPNEEEANCLDYNVHSPNEEEANCLDYNVHYPYEEEANCLDYNVHYPYEEEANCLDYNVHTPNEEEANCLDNVYLLHKQEANDLGNVPMLNEQHDNDQMLNEQHINDIDRDHMLNEHHIKPLGNAYILNKQEVNNHYYAMFLFRIQLLVNDYDNHCTVCLANDQYIITQPETVIYVSVAPLTSLASYASRSTQWSIFTKATGIADPACDVALNTAQPLYLLRLLTQFYLKIMLTMSNVMSCHYSNAVSVTEKCHSIKLKLRQNMLRKHDFKVFMQSMRTKTPITNVIALVIVSAVLQFCQVWNIVKYLFRITWKVIQRTTPMTKALRLLRLSIMLYIQAWKDIYCHFGYIRELFTLCHSQKTFSDRCDSLNSKPFIGGGKAKKFSYYEIQPYALSQNTFEASNEFKFVSHVLKDDIAIYSNVDSFVIVNDQSLRVLTPKFTIADLKTIGASHGVFFHSKMNHKSLQLAIEDHICHNCSTYVLVFKFIDKTVILNERKILHNLLQ